MGKSETVLKPMSLGLVFSEINCKSTKSFWGVSRHSTEILNSQETPRVDADKL